MSAYDDAVAYLDAEVLPRCDYDIYSDMRDIVDEMEDQNAKLRELVRRMYTCMDHVEGLGVYYDCENCALNNDMGECDFEELMRALGIEVGP